MAADQVPGFGEPKVYRDAMATTGFESETIAGELQERLNAGILQVMEGRAGDPANAAGHDAIAELQARGVDGIILGCTEIPFLVGTAGDNTLNPIELLAEAAVDYALA